MLENFKEVVEALEATNESVLSHRLNDVLRVLTAFSVIILPLTLIAAHLRHERRASRARARIEAFWIVIGVMVVVLVGCSCCFRRRGWL